MKGLIEFERRIFQAKRARVMILSATLPIIIMLLLGCQAAGPTAPATTLATVTAAATTIATLSPEEKIRKTEMEPETTETTQATPSAQNCAPPSTTVQETTSGTTAPSAPRGEASITGTPTNAEDLIRSTEREAPAETTPPACTPIPETTPAPTSDAQPTTP